jgi:hypothetical protein
VDTPLSTITHTAAVQWRSSAGHTYTTLHTIRVDANDRLAPVAYSFQDIGDTLGPRTAAMTRIETAGYLIELRRMQREEPNRVTLTRTLAHLPRCASCGCIEGHLATCSDPDNRPSKRSYTAAAYCDEPGCFAAHLPASDYCASHAIPTNRTVNTDGSPSSECWCGADACPSCAAADAH